MWTNLSWEIRLVPVSKTEICKGGLFCPYKMIFWRKKIEGPLPPPAPPPHALFFWKILLFFLLLEAHDPNCRLYLHQICIDFFWIKNDRPESSCSFEDQKRHKLDVSSFGSNEIHHSGTLAYFVQLDKTVFNVVISFWCKFNKLKLYIKPCHTNEVFTTFLHKCNFDMKQESKTYIQWEARLASKYIPSLTESQLITKFVLKHLLNIVFVACVVSVRQACLSHNQIRLLFGYASDYICQTQPEYPQIVTRQCCLVLTI